MKVVVVIGTRPEAIKLAPVIKEIRDQGKKIELRVVVTAQHRELLDQVLDVFDIKPDYDLDLMRPQQSLTDVACRALPALEAVFANERPDMVLVQGDTTSVFVASLAAFYQRIPVGHVEAGLRSYNRYDPFPEEMNRRLTSVLAALHFAPTELARENLLREGVPREKIFITGNTVVDALQEIVASQRFREVRLPIVQEPQCRLILVTLHRRESWGETLAEMCRALREIVRRHPGVKIVFPVHMNPAVRQTVSSRLEGTDRISLLEPVDYLTFLALMNVSYLVLTDSGGVQEEAPVLGKPVLVLRGTTERREAIEAGVSKLVGTRYDDIVKATGELLDNPETYRKMAREISPFGDGQAAKRIREIILSKGGFCLP